MRTLGLTLLMALTLAPSGATADDSPEFCNLVHTALNGKTRTEMYDAFMNAAALDPSLKGELSYAIDDVQNNVLFPKFRMKLFLTVNGEKRELADLGYLDQSLYPGILAGLKERWKNISQPIDGRALAAPFIKAGHNRNAVNRMMNGGPVSTADMDAVNTKVGRALRERASTPRLKQCEAKGLVDTKKPPAPVVSSGGDGYVCDWSPSEPVRSLSQAPGKSCASTAFCVGMMVCKPKPGLKKEIVTHMVTCPATKDAGKVYCGSADQCAAAQEKMKVETPADYQSQDPRDYPSPGPRPTPGQGVQR